MSDRAVELRLSPVGALVLAYDSTETPSAFRPPRVYTATALRSWQVDADINVWVNDPDRDERALDALRVDWLAGSAADLAKCRYRFGLTFGHGLPYFMIQIGCDRLESFAGEQPLSLQDWAGQYAAWWREWSRRQDPKRRDPDAADQPVLKPAVDPSSSPIHEWPGEPVAEWEPTDTPPELLAAIAAWCEAQFRPVSYDWGVRFYARQVDSWWAEGKRAGVTVRGIEDGRPGTSAECVHQFLLRRKSSGWVAEPLSRGWPPYGSAPERPANEKPWLLRWRSGEVLSRRRS
jgi:hypothetical protein